MSLSRVNLLKEINSLILDIYQKSFCNDFIFFRYHICDSINKILPFDTISWYYLDNKGKTIGTICSPLFDHENGLAPPENLSLNSKKASQNNQPHANFIITEHDKHLLTASFAASNKKSGHRIKLFRKANN